MSDAPNLDPFGLARTWMAQWEKLVNEHGTELLAKPEAARAMQALSEGRWMLAAAGGFFASGGFSALPWSCSILTLTSREFSFLGG